MSADGTDLARSRPLRVVELASGGSAPDLTQKVVTVSGDADLHTSPAMRLLMTNLRRLPVVLQIHGFPDDVAADLATACAKVAPDLMLRVGRPVADGIHVHLGTTSPDADVSAVPCGHGARLRRRGHAFPSTVIEASGLGELFTAAVLTGEAFKDIVGLGSGRARRLETLDLCPVSLTDQFAAVGPPPNLRGFALVGAGAIGTAVVAALGLLDASGELTVVDPQTFADENLGTYTIGTIDDVGADKVSLMKAHLPAVTVTPFVGTAIQYVEALEATQGPWPTTVLGALDSIEARHQAARLHAELLLDGSTGGRAGTTLSLSETRWTGPCLRCFYPGTSTSGASVLQQVADATCLPLERLTRGDDALTEDDISELPPEAQALLRPHLGKPVCGLARDLGFGSDFDPSVIFIAQQAAALVVGALVRRHTEPNLEARDVEYDALFGSNPDAVENRRASGDCICQRDKGFHGDLRAARGQTP